MQRSTKLIAAGAVVAAGLAAGTGIAMAGGEDEGEGPDVPITGDDLARAEAAALEETGGGEVTETEVGDEESFYEVEVTMPDGTQIDVQLDEGFQVVGTESEPGGEADDD